MSWGVFEERDDVGRFRAYHVVPVVQANGDILPSAAHTLSANCDCKPLHERSRYDIDLYNHHDPDADGAMAEDDWEKKKTQGIAQ
jgi:hypothetical protein